MNIVEKSWEQILNKMKSEYCSSNISYNTWIAPLTVYEVTDDTVYILVKLKASLEHIEDKYLLPFKVCIAEVTGIEYEISFVTEDNLIIQEKKENTIKKQKSNAIFANANLNSKYTCSFPGRSRISRRDLQSTIYIWRRRAWENSSYAFHCTFHTRK